MGKAWEGEGISVSSRSTEIFEPYLVQFLGTRYEGFQPSKYIWVADHIIYQDTLRVKEGTIIIMLEQQA